MFVFGATSFETLLHNYSLLKRPFRLTKYKVIHMNDFYHLYEQTENNLVWICLLRKKFRYVTRFPHRFDEEGDSCKVCLAKKACILLQPCSHFGLCNGCTHKIYGVRFSNNSIKKQTNKLSKCPFCFQIIHALQFVFIV